jgi:hypothetical protein
MTRALTFSFISSIDQKPTPINVSLPSVIFDEEGDAVFHLSRVLTTLTAMRWRSWLRHCATSRKVTGSSPDELNGNFHWRNPSDCIRILGLTQPLTEISTGDPP